MRPVCGRQCEGSVHPTGPVNPQGGAAKQPGQPRKRVHQHGGIIVLLSCPDCLLKRSQGLGEVACTRVEGCQGDQARLEAAAVCQGVWRRPRVHGPFCSTSLARHAPCCSIWLIESRRQCNVVRVSGRAYRLQCGA